MLRVKICILKTYNLRNDIKFSADDIKFRKENQGELKRDEFIAKMSTQIIR